MADTVSKTSGLLFIPYFPVQAANEGHKRNARDNQRGDGKQNVRPIIVFTAL